MEVNDGKYAIPGGYGVWNLPKSMEFQEILWNKELELKHEHWDLIMETLSLENGDSRWSDLTIEDVDLAKLDESKLSKP